MAVETISAGAAGASPRAGAATPQVDALPEQFTLPASLERELIGDHAMPYHRPGAHYVWSTTRAPTPGRVALVRELRGAVQIRVIGPAGVPTGDVLLAVARYVSLPCL